MNIESIKIGVVAAFSLFIFYANESMAGRRDGSIGLMAEVDCDADMDWKSLVGPLSVVKARAHLHRYAQIGAHVHIDEGVSIHRKGIVMDHSRIQTGAIIGNGTLCKVSTNVGPYAIVSDGAVLGLRAKVMSHSKVGRNGVVGFFASIGRRVAMEKYVAVSERATVGTGGILSKYSVVQVAVNLPAGTKVGAKQIVIGAPETTNLLQMISEWEFSNRFYKAVDVMTAKSDSRFARHFSRELGYILSDLSKDCQNNKSFRRHLLYLVYSYLRRMHGSKQLDQLKKGRSEPNDCDNARRYDKIFDKKTVEHFLVLMAIYYDFGRQTRIKGEVFCSIVKDLLTSERSVLAINDKCGGTTTAECNGCGSGDGTAGSQLIRQSDVNWYSGFHPWMAV